MDFKRGLSVGADTEFLSQLPSRSPRVVAVVYKEAATTSLRWEH